MTVIKFTYSDADVILLTTLSANMYATSLVFSRRTMYGNDGGIFDVALLKMIFISPFNAASTAFLASTSPFSLIKANISLSVSLDTSVSFEPFISDLIASANCEVWSNF